MGKKAQQEHYANTGKETDTPVSARNEKSAPALWLVAALVYLLMFLYHSNTKFAAVRAEPPHIIEFKPPQIM